MYDASSDQNETKEKMTSCLIRTSHGTYILKQHLFPVPRSKVEVLKTSQRHLDNHLETGWLLGKVETSKNLAVFL